jgi:Flp pilus assembly protein TadG
MKSTPSKPISRRRGVIAVLSAVLFIVTLAIVAFAVDVGYLAVVRTQLQAAADSAALASAGASNQSRSGMIQVAQAFAAYHQIGARPVVLNAGDVKFGIWDVATRTFTELGPGDLGTAVKVTVRADAASGGLPPLFFGRVLGANPVAEEASAVAMVNPRDIAFVVDLSGSMNWDTNPGKSSASDSLLQQVYDDFHFGTYPGTQQTRLSGSITTWMDGQLHDVMPNALPTPSSGSAESRLYWQQYYNYVGYSGKVGYKTYVQFMMEKGRDEPVVAEVKDGQGQVTQQAQYSPLSILSGGAASQRRYEETDGGWFYFPAREMPTHACRRAIIAALKVIADRNALITDPSQKDKVSLVTFDAKNSGQDATHVQVVKSLTFDYAGVMDACRTLQACNSNASSTDSEGGLICAYNHIKPISQGGQGRENANKVVVFLTDGLPNIYESSTAVINAAMTAHPGDWGSSYAQNGALMQALNRQGDNWSLYAVGVGLGGDQAFMDRMARKAGTAKDGASYPMASDSSAYETTLKSIFNSIITNPRLRLVK